MRVTGVQLNELKASIWVMPDKYRSPVALGCIIQRREFITLLSSTAASSVSWPLPASAQAASIYRLGTLGPRDPFDDKSPFGSILVHVLAQRGYTLGQNLTLNARGAMGDMHRLPQLLQEMKADKVEAAPAPSTSIHQLINKHEVYCTQLFTNSFRCGPTIR